MPRRSSPAQGRRRAALAVACALTLLGAAAAPADATVVRHGLAFGTAGRQTLRLDLYRPDGRRHGRRSPAIVWIHGGGFTRGDRTLMRPYARRFAARGYVAATIDYRLAERAGLFTEERTQAMLDAQHDAQAAVRWMRRRAATFGVDPGRIVVAGQSAGAMTALNVALHPERPEDRVRAAVSIAGYAPEPRWDGDPPPLLLLHGTADRTVPYRYARRTCASAHAAGASCTLVAYRGAPHEMSRTRIPQLTARAVRWLRRVLRRRSATARAASGWALRASHGVRFGRARNERGRMTTLRMDLYRPKKAAPPEGRRAVIWIHGGGFTSGHRRLMRGYAKLTARRGDVGVTIDYRLVRRNVLFAPGRTPGARGAQHDAQAAVRWLRKNAARFRIDPARIYVGGGSAGAMTALNVAMHAEDPGDSGTVGPEQVSSEVRGAISIAGFASAPRFVRTPPLLLFHGTRDDRIQYWRGVRTCRQARAAHVPCELVTYRKAGHPMIGRKMVRIERRAAAWMRKIERRATGG